MDGLRLRAMMSILDFLLGQRQGARVGVLERRVTYAMLLLAMGKSRRAIVEAKNRTLHEFYD
ncbi:MAG: hypothetical protein COB53_01115 [Elusimicrobia bacterium]|nr:MAG: hypothetical protein COB53_01115 [Elusimicrobiota bacterium]